MTSIIDNSVPLGTSNLNLAIINSLPTQPYVTSNVLSNVLLSYITSNTLSNILTLKQDKLISTSVLYGDGGNISAINWNNITTNKPATFPSDFTTMANKPTNPNGPQADDQDDVDNVLADPMNKNKPEVRQIQSLLQRMKR